MTSGSRTKSPQVTLARALSKLGIASRRQAAQLVRDGKVTVNGRVIREPGRWLDPRTDILKVEGERVRRRAPVYLALHKPAGIVTTRSDERGRRTVYDLLPPGTEWVFPIGRLDKETTGLLLLTNDTQFGERLTNPLRKVAKTYRVELDRPLSPDDRRRMTEGMVLSDGTKLKPAIVHQQEQDSSVFELTIVEGKNRQIRRMCEKLGHAVLALKRIRIGAIELGSLAEGKTRALTKGELAFILEARREGEN